MSAGPVNVPVPPPLNYHWDKARQKAARTMERLPNNQEFILIISGGMVAWAQSRNYMHSSEGLLRYVMSSIDPKDPRYAPLVEKLNGAVEAMNEVKVEMKRLESPIVDAHGNAITPMSAIVQPDGEKPSEEGQSKDTPPSEEQKN